MKFKNTEIAQSKTVLLNYHYVAVPYNCSEVSAKENGVIPAGTVIPSNDEKAIGVLLSDVSPDENPNGTVVVHGFIDVSKMPDEPAAEAIAAMKNICFFKDGSIFTNAE